MVRSLLLAFLLALVLPTATFAGRELPELTYGEWTMKCDRPEPAPGRCGMYWAIRLADNPEPGFLVAIAGYDKDRLILAALSSRKICARPASTMQIDGYPEVVLHPEQEEAVVVPEKLSSEILRQAHSGTMMFLRIHSGPACTPADHAVPLTGFNDAWNQLPR